MKFVAITFEIAASRVGSVVVTVFTSIASPRVLIAFLVLAAGVFVGLHASNHVEVFVFPLIVSDEGIAMRRRGVGADTVHSCNGCWDHHCT